MRVLLGILSIVLVMSMWPTRGLAYEFKRALRVDWEEIPGANRYEVEWFSGEGCSKSEGTTMATKNVWVTRLQPGNYCMRVRGISSDGETGQWTDFQKLSVNPKTPPNIKRVDEKTFSWDKDPSAKGYQVNIQNDQGKSVYSTFSKDAEIKLPEALAKDPKYLRQILQLNVVTEVEGGLVSAPAVEDFKTPLALAEDARLEAESGAKAKAEQLASAQKPAPPPKVIPPIEQPPRKLPPQPAPEPLKGDESVQQFFIANETPIAPSADDWAQAKTPEQRALLRQRTIASARVELSERVERYHPPDLRLEAGSFVGSAELSHSASPQVFTSEKMMNLGYHLGVEYGQEQPWGLRVGFDQNLFSSNSIRYNFTRIAVDSLWHFSLDSVWESVLTFGLGIQYSQFPIGEDFSDPRYYTSGTSGATTFSYQLSTLAPKIDLGYRYKLSPRWTAETATDFAYGFRQLNFKNEIQGVSSLGVNFSIGPSYQFSRELLVRGGIGFSYQRGKNDSGSLYSKMMETGVYIQGVYRMSGSEERRPAAETAFQAEIKRLWEVRLELPYSMRYQTAFTTLSSSAREIPSNESASFIKQNLRIQKNFSENAGLVLGVGMERNSFGSSLTTTSLEEQLFEAYAGYEGPLFNRRDLTYTLAAGPGFREAAGPADQAIISISDLELQFHGQIEKSWSAQWTSQLCGDLGLPISVKPGSIDTANTDAGVTTGSSMGFNYDWRLAGYGGYRLTSAVTAWGGYAYQQLRLGMQTSGSQVMDYSENQFRLGLSLRW